MSTFSLLAGGFSSVLTPIMLLAAFVGAIAGTLVGVLPGLGPAAAIAVLLPATYGLDPLVGLITLAGMYYGAMYGGTITSVLLNVPGESASVVTTFDGYPMAKAGRGGVALGIAAIGSFIAGTLGLILLTLIAVPLARIAIKFGPPEYFAVMLLVFAMISGLNSGKRLKAFLSLFLGLFLATVGQDVVSGMPRLTGGSITLLDGIPFLPAVIGAFGLSEVVQNIIEPAEFVTDGKTKIKVRDVLPNRQDIKESAGSIVRGGFIGFFTGLLPGGGGSLSSFLSYGLEKRLSKTPEKFGNGAIQGVAGPESANNAASTGSFVPLLSLGIPSSGTSAVLLGAFVMLGIQPGPGLFAENPDVVWGLIASMYIGNIMLLILNTAFIPSFIWLLKISQRTLSVIVATMCFVGVYSLSYSMFDVWLMIFFTILGYAFKVYGVPGAPLVIALVLGGQMEYSLRQSLVMSMGSPSIFFERPISAVLVTLTLLILVGPPILEKFRNRNKASGQTT